MIAYSSLMSLGAIGSSAVLLSVGARDGLPTATTWLLFACGSLQVSASLCGLAGFRNKNRECIRWLFVILLLGTAVLIFVAVSAFEYMASGEPKKPENVLLVFAIAITCAVVNASTIIFVFFFYCKLSKAFTAAGRGTELPVHYSSNHQKFGKRRGKKWE